MLLIIVLVLFITWKIYEYTYYKGEKFNKLKKDLNDYILSCNALNDHIEELKQTYSNVKKINYGTAELNDSSRYNFKRPEQLKAKKSEFIYDCSSTVCKNAEQQPFKYLCKYFNIKANEESLENFENILNNFSAAEEGKYLLNNELEKIKRSINNDIPFLIRTFSMKKFMSKLGFKVIDFSTLYFPVYTFRYVSPGGNKSTHCNIKLDIDNLNNFVEYLSEIVKFRKSAAGQRALMTSKLREKIKQRDNYTCQKCGLSINDERNLLLEIDHIVPISKGGMSTEENLQTLCWKCNRTKGAKLSS
ncbi:MAG: HNH endonuclease [Paeniclostridium sp.]|nr:HNH endonuclease signature motif containing protein [Paeniclostridium sp.]MBW4862604.1 HNH endonuclease [Paeniclostridium sp.]MBW4874929.1 HNH endonuclease [Paeniclostridium sp.]